ncbi:hypothetical protein Tco_0472063 [Tanacetum coccineum]
MPLDKVAFPEFLQLRYGVWRRSCALASLAALSEDDRLGASKNTVVDGYQCMVEVEVEAKKADGSSSSTNGLPWLTRKDTQAIGRRKHSVEALNDNLR